MKTILLVSTSFPSFLKKYGNQKKGGAEFLGTEVKGLLSAGYRVVVTMPLKENLDELEEHDQLIVHRFNYPFKKWNNAYYHNALYSGKGIKNSFALMVMMLFFIRTIFKNIRRYKPDLIWANWLQMGTLSYLANFGKIPIMVSLRGDDVRSFPPRLVKICARLTPVVFNMFKADEEIKGWIKAYDFREIKVPSLYRNKNFEKEEGRKFKIVVLGRLNNEAFSQKFKGIGSAMIQVFDRLLSEDENLQITLIGEGELRQLYESELTKKHSNIHFTGWMTEFSNELKSADLLIGSYGVNGVTMEAVPYEIPVFISNQYESELWKDRVNCVKADPLDEDGYFNTLKWAIRNRKELHEFAQQAKHDFQNYAQPIVEGGEVWKQAIEEQVLLSNA